MMTELEELEELAAEHRKKWRWRAYKLGEHVADAGVRILSEPIIRGPEMRHTLYDVEYTCCGLQRRIDHERIKIRARQKTTRCRACGRRNGWEKRHSGDPLRGAAPQVINPPALPKYNWLVPPWGKPTHVPLGYMLDCDKGGVR